MIDPNPRTPARHLTQEEADYHAHFHLQLAHMLLERIGNGALGAVSDGYVNFDPSDRERGEFYTDAGERMRSAIRGVLVVCRDFLAECLYGRTTGEVDTRLLGDTLDLFQVAATALESTDPDVARGLMNMADTLLRRAETEVGKKEVAHV